MVVFSAFEACVFQCAVERHGNVCECLSVVDTIELREVASNKSDFGLLDTMGCVVLDTEDLPSYIQRSDLFFVSSNVFGSISPAFPDAALIENSTSLNSMSSSIAPTSPEV